MSAAVICTTADRYVVAEMLVRHIDDAMLQKRIKFKGSPLSFIAEKFSMIVGVSYMLSMHTISYYAQDAECDFNEEYNGNGNEDLGELVNSISMSYFHSK